MAVVSAGLAVVMAARAIRATRVGLGEPGSDNECDGKNGLHGGLPIDCRNKLQGNAYNFLPGIKNRLGGR